jgi:hypothetical protein
LNAVKAASVILGTGGLIAVVDLFGPLMPENVQGIFVLVLILVIFVEFLTIAGVFMTGLAEGLSPSHPFSMASARRSSRCAAICSRR